MKITKLKHGIVVLGETSGKDSTETVTVTVVLLCNRIRNYCNVVFISEGKGKGFYKTTCSN